MKRTRPRRIRSEQVAEMHQRLAAGETRFQVAIAMDVDPSTVGKHTRGQTVVRARKPDLDKLKRRVHLHTLAKSGEIRMEDAVIAAGFHSRLAFLNAVSTAKKALKRAEDGHSQIYPSSGKGPRKRDTKSTGGIHARSQDLSS